MLDWDSERDQFTNFEKVKLWRDKESERERADEIGIAHGRATTKTKTPAGHI